MSMSLESGALGAVITKFGWLKVLSLGAALIGATIMVAFRPPKTRKELFVQAAVALGGSLLFGDFFVALVDSHLHLGNSLIAPIHGLIGAVSWGAFGGIAHLRDRVGADPLGTLKEVKDVISK